MFGFFKRRRAKVQKNLSKDLMNLRVYSARVNAMITMAQDNEKIVEALKLLQHDLYYTTPVGSKDAVKQLHKEVCKRMDKLDQMFASGKWDADEALQEIRFITSRIQNHAAMAIK